jgi:hypothetical protein
MADSQAITPWPGPGWVFDPPPGWPVGRDFDPVRGKGVDPSWPDAPEGWKFWAPATLAAAHPIGAQGATVDPAGDDATTSGRGRAATLAIGVLVLVIVVGSATWLWNRVGPGEVVQKDGVGSCWAPVESGPSDSYEPVSCSDDRAEYRVSSAAPTSDACPLESDTYMETPSGDGVWCLTPVP